MTTTAVIQNFDPLIFFNGIRDKVMTALELIAPYLDHPTLAQCRLVNCHLSSICGKQLWESPDFRKGYIRDPLQRLIKFVNHLPELRPQTRQSIKKIDLSNIEESLYERVPASFFATLVRYTPNLEILNLAHTRFLSASSVLNLPPHWSLDHLHTLDLSYCEGLSDDMLVRLAFGLPALRTIRLDAIRIDRGLAAFADRADKLTSISIRHAPSLTDDTLFALAKLRNICLKHVDLTGCPRITDAGLAMMARYNVHLVSFSVAQTSCSASTAAAFLRKSRILERFDLSGCPEIDKEKDLVLCALYETKTIKQLDLSMNMASAVREVCPTIEQLTIHDVPEGTPMSFLTHIIQLFPNASSIHLIRDYYETDFMLSFVSEQQEPQAVLNEDQLTEFNKKQQRVKVTMANRRDQTLTGLTMEFW